VVALFSLNISLMNAWKLYSIFPGEKYLGYTKKNYLKCIYATYNNRNALSLLT